MRRGSSRELMRIRATPRGGADGQQQVIIIVVVDMYGTAREVSCLCHGALEAL